MHLSDRIIVCSALAAAVAYILYRRRHRPRRELCSALEKDQALSEESSPIPPIFHAPEAHFVPDLEQCVEFHSISIPAVAKVTLCTNICLAKPQSFSEEVATSIVAPSSVLDIESSEVPDEVIIPENNQMVDLAVYGRSPDSPDSSCDHPHTPESQYSSNGEAPDGLGLPPGYFNDPTNDIYEDNPEELNGTMLPKVLIPSDMWAEAVDKDIWHETFCVPAHMGGVLIGRLGKNVRELKNIWQAEFSLNTCPGRQDTLIFKLSCPIKHKDDVLHWVSKRFRMRPSRTPIGNPNQLKRFLPLGDAVPVHVRSMYASKEFFVTIRDEEYAKYLQMQSELDADYSAATGFRIQLCEPVTSGTVAVVPHSQGFARALVISVYPTWPKSVFYFLLDHGIFGVVALNKLRKIRAKYMRTPFQAIHVSWAHAYPVFSDVPDIHVLRTFFSSGRIHAFAVRMETCCRASVAFGEPYPPPYSNSGMLDILLNAYNSGLYMAVPLAIYPNRQAWLNGTSIPYYPFTYSAIDYPSLVSFVEEDSSSPAVDAGQNETDSHSRKNTEPKQRVTNFARRSTVPSRNRGSRGSGTGSTTRRPFIWNQRNSARSTHHGSYVTSQKENENIDCSTASNHTHAKPSQTAGITSVSAEPKPRPLGVRNVRGNNTSALRSNYNRGRGSTRPR